MGLNLGRSAARVGRNGTPPENCSARPPAISTASRVLPMPPGPVMVTRRTSVRARSSRAAAASLFAADESVACDRKSRGAKFDLARGSFPASSRESRKFAREFTCCGETARRILFQAALDGPAERCGSIALRRDNWLVLFAHDGDGSVSTAVRRRNGRRPVTSS